jgi:hypothetical protein
MPFGLSKVLSPAAIRRETSGASPASRAAAHLPVMPLAVSFTPDWQLQAKTKKPADIAAAGSFFDTSACKICKPISERRVQVAASCHGSYCKSTPNRNLFHHILNPSK